MYFSVPKKRKKERNKEIKKKKKRKEKNVELNVIGMNSQYIYNNKEKKEEN